MLSLVTGLLMVEFDLALTFEQLLLFALGQSGPFDNTLTELAKNEQLMDGIPKGLRIEHTAQVTKIFQFTEATTLMLV